MALVFINYRSFDVGWSASVIQEKLAERFGAEQVYCDYRSIQPGQRYPDHILDAVRRADVLLAVIGPGWLTAQDAGGRLLDRPRDWVRREIALALECGTLVIPVLLDDQPRLRREDLPADIADLALRQVFRIRRQTHVADLQRLGDLLAERLPGLAAAPPTAAAPTAPARTRRALLLGVAALTALTTLAGALIGVALIGDERPDSAAPASSPPPSTSGTAGSGTAGSDSRSSPPASPVSTGTTPHELPTGRTRLTDLEIVEGAENVRPEREATLYGRTYPDSIQVDCEYAGSRDVQYRLGRQYTKLTGHFGVLDVAGSVDVASLTVRGPVEGASFQTAVANAPPVPVDIDVTGVDVLVISFYCSSTGNARGVLAAPTLVGAVS